MAWIMRWLSVVSVFASLTAGASNVTGSTYDFYLLVLQYGPALCTDGTFSCPTKAAWTYFTLHGLWPENNDGT
jgi:ribonuclease I